MRHDGSVILNPGLLRHQLTWQRKYVTGQNGVGEDEYDWTDVCEVRARVLALTGKELEIAQQRWPEARYRIEQHFVAGMEHGFRAEWQTPNGVRYLDALDILDPAGTGAMLVIVAKEWAV